MVETARVKIDRVVHTIHAVDDLAACRARYLDLLGGWIFAEGYFAAEDRDMALLYVADHMVEPMAPRAAGDLTKPFARYLQRNGAGWHSFELRVADARDLGARLKAAGCKLATDYGFFFFVRPESTGGVLLEVCEAPMPNDPRDRRNWRADWAEGGPSGLLALDHIACVVRDVEKAVAFFTTFLDGEVLEDAPCRAPQPARRVVLRLGDTRVAFIQPDDPESGALGAFLQGPNAGVYALVWRIEDEAQARAFFRANEVRTVEAGCVSAGFAIDPADFLGARHEFARVEERPAVRR